MIWSPEHFVASLGLHSQQIWINQTLVILCLCCNSNAFESFTLTSCSVLMTRLTDGAECVGHDASCSRNIKLSWKQTVNKRRMTPSPSTQHDD